MTGDDRLIPLARWVFLPLAAVTTVFGPLLVLAPGQTAHYWSWPISPAMSAVWVGAGYTFGACAISTMLVLNRWRTSILAIAATIPFAFAMAIATLLHLDRFALGTVRFGVWAAIYLLLPVGLPVIYALNRRSDPGIQPDDRLLPRSLRYTAGVAGVAIDLFAVALFVDPVGAAPVWPWVLTPLMAQVVAGWLMFFGTGAAMLLVEPRFRAVKPFLPCVAVWFAVLTIAALGHLSDFTSAAATVAFLGATVAVVVASLATLLFGRRLPKLAER